MTGDAPRIHASRERVMRWWRFRLELALTPMMPPPAAAPKPRTYAPDVHSLRSPQSRRKSERRKQPDRLRQWQHDIRWHKKGRLRHIWGSGTP